MKTDKEIEELRGKQVYPNWRLDKNISWFNVQSIIGGFIYAHLTFLFLRNWKEYKRMINPFNAKLWLPPRYAEDYKRIYYDKGDEDETEIKC